MSRRKQAKRARFYASLRWGAVRIDENGVMTHIPYPELMAELEAVADRLEAP